MLSNKGVGTADQWERATATQLYSFFGVVDQTLTHFFWSTRWEVISKFPSHSSLFQPQLGSIFPYSSYGLAVAVYGSVMVAGDVSACYLINLRITADPRLR